MRNLKAEAPAYRSRFTCAAVWALPKLRPPTVELPRSRHGVLGHDARRETKPCIVQRNLDAPVEVRLQACQWVVDVQTGLARMRVAVVVNAPGRRRGKLRRLEGMVLRRVSDDLHGVMRRRAAVLQGRHHDMPEAEAHGRRSAR